MATLQATAAPPAEAGQQQQAHSQGGSSDAFVIHPHLYPSAPLKAPLSNPSLRKALGKCIAKGSAGEKQARRFIDALIEARGALSTVLESPSVSEQAVSAAVAEYLSLLLGLIGSGSGSAAGSKLVNGAAAATSPDEALSAAELGAGSGSLLSAPPSKLRHAGQYEWTQTVLAGPPGGLQRKAAVPDALFELASVLVAAAVRLMHAAGQACRDSASGVPTPASTRGYQLLREAAGMLEFVVGGVLPALPAGLSADCDLQLGRGLASTALADAQQLTVLRAVAKGNQPSLISSLAADTSALYSQACSQVGASAVPGAANCKLLQYGQYKMAVFAAYAHCFNGISLWKRNDNCGGGLKSLEAATSQLEAAKKAAAGFDASPPATLNLPHRRVDEDLERIIRDTRRVMERENNAVFLQRLAADVPMLPEGKRMVGALPYALPQPAAMVREGVVDQGFAAGSVPAAPTAAPGVVMMQSGGTADGKPAAAASAAAAGGSGATGEEQGCSCCRWTAAIIAAPILALLWLVGAVIWVVLLPPKCCCPCCGFPLQWAASLVLWLLSLPARTLMWASGKPWQEGENQQQQQGGGGKEQK